ncbi:outer dense fiber protein 2 isoform X1 [Latimeria chalumnae]|nr:PREDICTED: outer dense fiber protein 2 isoform X2 [Latimeria chalumnae]XP_014341651.1 PREDICTED: outer dense fiber protein 2 isoform X2 [Latimeria chalumnae]XP_014341652.1 PREDICTED: outer dense fiber protein 2 isoform X2 [Latimeria chalumnae]|eukprot:XP_014341650.1 PREDICTED: outer dense fiber protein 2 isoform X2 [Latimeria chalumnae]
MKTRAASPPLHVHVDESTPVHVHVKKSQRSSSAKAVQPKIQDAKMKREFGNLRPTAKVKTRVPWIPPGKTSLRESGYRWEGPTHRLEITPVDTGKDHSALHLSDLSTDEEEVIHGKMKEYEKRIDSLMNEVGSLKTEAELRKKDHLLEKQEKELNLSKQAIQEREEELEEVAQELEQKEQENTRLRHSIERMIEETDYSRIEKEHLLQEKDRLLKKLVEAEMDGAAAAKQVTVLRETIGKLKTEKRMTSSDVNLLTRQKELLLQKLTTFETTNRTLRQLLREQHSQETDAMRLAEQKEVLLKKLTNSEAENARLVLRLQDREKEVDQLLIQVQTEKDNMKSTTELSKSLEVTRAHLQGQLRNKEAENNRMAVQIRNLERTLAQNRGEMDHLLDQLKELKQRGERDKEALKKATRAQKQRAERSEDTVEQLNAQLMEKETQLADTLSTLETWRSRHNKVLKEKNQLEIEISVTNNRITDLTDQLHNMEDKSRAERESLVDKLHRLTSENTSTKLEYERLKAKMAAVEEKLTFAQSEIQQLKASVKQYEGLVDNYKSQVLKTRMEADEFCMKLEMAEQENKLLKDDMNKEIDLVRRQLQCRLTELEPLPEHLKVTEMNLQACQEQLRDYERRHTEQLTSITDLRFKIEQQGDQMEATRERYHNTHEENNRLKLKLESMERKLEEADLQNRELVQVVAKREETIHQNQVRLEEKSRECSTLARQLESAVDDARRQVDQTRERTLSKERSTQSKIVDLETQLSRTKTELNQLRRSKEDIERRLQSRLQDLKDRLEQSESTNRSMQNYVQFLKSSYANVFGETTLTSSPIRPRSPI